MGQRECVVEISFWLNLVVTFQLFLMDLQNRSAKLLSVEMQPDFLNPSKRGYLQNKCLEKNGSAHNPEELDKICSEKFDLWPILVRTISFLLIRSR